MTGSGAEQEEQRRRDPQWPGVPQRLVGPRGARRRRPPSAGAWAVLGACLAARALPHPAYAGMAPDDRDAVVLARALGWTSDRIAAQLQTSEADVRARLARGLRTLRLPRDCAAGASPARAGHAS